MFRYGLLLVSVLSLVLVVNQVHAQTLEENSSSETQDQDSVRTQQQDLVEALELLLGDEHSADKRGTIALCGMGDRCAMKFGPRIGKLCACGRGANCNSYLLRCI